jgi:GTPase SAR1 family protein
LPIVYAANKCDLFNDDATLKAKLGDMKSQAAQMGAQYIECSARTGENVEEAFTMLVREISFRRHGTPIPRIPVKKTCSVL